MHNDYYGQSNSDNEIKTVQERCREFYSVADFVIIMNIDTQPFVYQIQRPENQSVNEDGVHKNIYDVKPPERIIMQPGDTRLVPAYEADLMIKSLIDKIVYSKRAIVIAANKGKETQEPPRESVMDPETQRKYIREIYQGKRDFLEEYNNSLKNHDVAKDLEDEPPTTAPRRPGRPARQAA